MDYSSSSQMQLNRPIIEEPDDTLLHQSQMVRPDIRNHHQGSFEQYQMRSEPDSSLHKLTADMASLRSELNSMKHKNQLLWNHLANLEQHNQALLKEDAKNNKKIEKLISIVEQIVGKQT